MSGIKHKLAREAFGKGFDIAYSKLEKDISKGTYDLLDLAKKHLPGLGGRIPYDKIEEGLKDPNSVVVKYIERVFGETDRNLLKTLFLNLGFEAFYHGSKTAKEAEDEYGIKLPKVIALYPWEDGNLNSGELIDIVSQGKEIGIFIYLIMETPESMGVDCIFDLCHSHEDCVFPWLLDAGHINSDFASGIKEAGNIIPVVKIDETMEDSLDEVFSDLRDKGLFICSDTCYTGNNCESITSDDYMAKIIGAGVKLAFYYPYMPIGPDASPELMITPEQREYLNKRIREIRDLKTGKGILAFDVQKDMDYIGGLSVGEANLLKVKGDGSTSFYGFMKETIGNIKNERLIDIIRNGR